jgi:hypothetical protein
MDQTHRRVFGGEKVRAADKLVSLFESHTDIIVKGRWDTLFGHKIFVPGRPASKGWPRSSSERSASTIAGGGEPRPSEVTCRRRC